MSTSQPQQRPHGASSSTVQRRPSPDLRLAVSGARGRMGARICALAQASDLWVLVAALERGDAPPSGPLDVVIDFSSPEGAMAAMDLALTVGAGLVVGTTGLGPEAIERLRGAATRIPVLLAPNTSLGVAVLRHLVREAARLLPGFDIDIVESHHNRKKDAPSGTALALASASAEGGAPLPAERIHALRGGDTIGEHAVHFAGPGETIRLEHSAVSRDLFALGALRAGAWIAGRAPGWYAMEDVVGLPARR